MKEIDVTNYMAFRFWWSWIWKVIVYSIMPITGIIIISFFIGYINIVLYIIFPLENMFNTTVMPIFVNIIIPLSVLGLEFYLVQDVLKEILKAKYKNYRITVIDKQTNQEVENISTGMAIHFLWSFFWKILLCSLIVFYIIGYIFTIAGSVFYWSRKANLLSTFNYIMIFTIPIYLFKFIL